jgi:hypothetical protein
MMTMTSRKSHYYSLKRPHPSQYQNVEAALSILLLL